jgi:hypothetical protein
MVCRSSLFKVSRGAHLRLTVPVGMVYTLGRVYMLSKVRYLCVRIGGGMIHRPLARKSQHPKVGQVCTRGQWGGVIRCSRQPNLALLRSHRQLCHR